MPTVMTNEKGVPEVYLNKSEAAEFLGVSFPTFSANHEPKLQKYRSPRRRNVILFKKSDLEELAKVRPIEDEEEK